MASVRREIVIEVPPASVWSALRDVGRLHTRLVPGFVTDCVFDGPGRMVTFANGSSGRELIVDVDEAAMRVDPARYLEDDEAMAVYLTEALETGEPAYVAHALGVIARARGMSEVAREAGLSRETLYRTLSEDGNPELATLLRVLRALRIELSAAPARKKAA